MPRGVLVGVAVLVAACVVAAAAGASQPHFLGPTLTHPALPPDFALRDQHGRVVRLSAEKGKVVLVTFLYTHCVDLCPLTAIRLNAAVKSLGARGKNVAVIAISVDPKGDTPKSVNAFVRSHRLLPQFHYLTGSERALARVWRAYHVQSVKTGDPDHTLYTLLVDRSGKGRVLFDALALPRTVAHDARLLL